MVVMNRVESLLSSSCKRTAVMLQEAIRQREESSLTNEVEIRNFNESDAMTTLREYEKKKKDSMDELEAWYEEEVGVIENGFSEQLDAYEKELEAYRATCFVKAEKKEEELDRELKDDPPERASRIRSQVLERYHNKLNEGEHDIQERIRGVKKTIQHQVKEVEREYQKRKRAIEKEYSRATHAVKEELIEKKRVVSNACTDRREKARAAHTKALESCHDILNETLYQVRDLFRTYEEAYVDAFPISSLFLSSGVMSQTIAVIIKNLHLFCDIRVHEQVKRIHSIQNDIDAFQAGCDELIAAQAASENEPAEEAEDFRADRFLQSALSLQTEFIGRALLEIDDEATGFHGRVTQLREQFVSEVNVAVAAGRRREV